MGVGHVHPDQHPEQAFLCICSFLLVLRYLFYIKEEGIFSFNFLKKQKKKNQLKQHIQNTSYSKQKSYLLILLFFQPFYVPYQHLVFDIIHSKNLGLRTLFFQFATFFQIFQQTIFKGQKISKSFFLDPQFFQKKKKNKKIV